MSVRAVLFDLGGVIVRTEYQAPRQHLAESLGMDYDDIDRIVFGGGTNGSAARNPGPDQRG
jgi:beta-phosphoglucomutase-like phosphatase (HAD superfamily)